MNKGNYLNSVEAANLLGVNVSTIKRWTDSGKLKCMQTAGGHRKFLMKHINEYLSKHKEDTKKLTVIPYDTSEHRQINHLIQKHNITQLEPMLLNAALKSDRETVYMITTGLILAQYPVYRLFDKLISPVLHQIGDLWEKNTISIAEEHIASEIIRDSILLIQQILVKPEIKSHKALCFVLGNDQHDIPLKMAQIVLEQKGLEVFYIGQRTPVISLEKLISYYKPEEIYLSSTYYDDEWSEEMINIKHDELNGLYFLSEKYGFELHIGGNAFNKLKYDKKRIKRRLYTFEDAYRN